MLDHPIYDRFREQYGALWSAYPTASIASSEISYTSIMLDGISCALTLTRGRQVIDYVPAFVRRTISGARSLQSVGITVATVRDEMPDDFSFDLSDTASPTSIYEPRGPTAVRYRTDVCEIRIPAGPLRQRVTDVPVQNMPIQEALAGALLSFNAAHAVAIFTYLEAELSDFSTAWKVRGDDMSVYVYDAAEGGGSIAQQVYSIWAGSDEGNFLRTEAAATLKSTCCERYCERCILLPRLPEPVVRRGLLDKRLGRALLHD